ncbi:MAG: RNA-binding domain-containing protein [Chloroflexota bacterium]
MSRTNHMRPREKSRRDRQSLSWYRVDLHIHTPASADYQEPDVSLLDILRKAESRNADIIALTDHNTVRGYIALIDGIEKLELLEKLGRITPDEQANLDEYRRLLDKILVFPGVEFTATFGFHILGIFPPETSIRQLEHILLELNIPESQIEAGTGQVGATSDVLTAYEILNEAGALVIPAHVNSTHGVAMQNLPFGGQTKIAFTQSPYIHALEATDLESNSRRATKRFFNGSKPDYPRRMHVIQGSDAHRINRNPDKESDLGVCERMTELQLTDRSFEALKELFESNNYGRVRPHRATEDPYDFVRTARAEGNTIVQSFHARPPKRRGRLSPILRDVVALANGHGGTIFIGLSANPKEPVTGVKDAQALVQSIREDVARHVTPPINVTIDVGVTDNQQVVIVSVPGGSEKPYAVAPGNIYVRQEGETTLALRDEIVELVVSGIPEVHASALHHTTEALAQDATQDRPERRVRKPRNIERQPKAESVTAAESDVVDEPETPLPRTGVEIVDSVERDGVIYHSMKDLRNQKVVHNVTRDSARALWRYAIVQKEEHPCNPEDVIWGNGRGFWKSYKPRNAGVRFNLAYREPNGEMRVFYGVTEEGLDSAWRKVIPEKHLSGS